MTTPAPLSDNALTVLIAQLVKRDSTTGNYQNLWISAAAALEQLRAQRDEARSDRDDAQDIAVMVEVERDALRAMLAECRDEAQVMAGIIRDIARGSVGYDDKPGFGRQHSEQWYRGEGHMHWTALLAKVDAVLDARQEVMPDARVSDGSTGSGDLSGNTDAGVVDRSQTRPAMSGAHPSNTPTEPAQEGAARHAAPDSDDANVPAVLRDSGEINAGEDASEAKAPSASAPAPSTASDRERAAAVASRAFAVGLPHSVQVAIARDAAITFLDGLTAEIAAEFAAVRTEAYAAGIEDAARAAIIFPRGSAHTYASENADLYRAQEDLCETIAARIRSLATEERTP